MLDQETVNVLTKNINTDPNPYRKKYCVSREGKVHSIQVSRFKNNPDMIKSRKVELLTGDINFGYQRVKIGTKHERVHRLVAYLYCENPNNYDVVNHIDGNKLNNHYTNLEWCTAEHNEKHSLDTGLKPKGEAHYLATFTEAQLRACLEAGYYPKMTLKEFKLLVAPINCTEGQIGHLYRGTTWLSVTSQYGLVPLADKAATERVGNKARKLTYDDVVLLREDLAAAVLTITEVANKYSVSKVTVSKFYNATSFNGRDLPVLNLVKPAYKLEDKYSLATILAIKEQHALGKTRAELEQLFNINAQMCDKLRKLEDLSLFV